jgi:hypothetical protein
VRKSRKPAKAGTSGTLDAEKDGSVPATSGGIGGGSAFRGELLTEGAYLQPVPPSYVDSPFGQRYLVRKTRSMSLDDIVIRGQVWAFDVRGYHEYGTVTLDIPDTLGAENLLLDWYPLVRDMAKRSLKYKHVPTTLATTPALLRHWINAYFFVVANCTVLLNLNRLAMINTGLSKVTEFFPQYMSRVARLWRRTSALSAPSWIKAHAIRSGLIVQKPGFTCPVIRLWTSDVLLPTASGGPTITPSGNTGLSSFTTVAELTKLVATLESVEKWLEIGHASVGMVDFIAVKDLIDMTSDIVPGAFATGLPDGASMPGIVSDPGILTDIFARAMFWKDDQTTDKWAIFPIPEEGNFGGRVPIVGFGPGGSVYEHTLLGAPKYGHLNSLTARSANVDTIFRALGTDLCMGINGIYLCTDAALNARLAFGDLTQYGDEECRREGLPATSIQLFKAIDWDLAATVRDWFVKDSIASKHVWSHGMGSIRSGFVANEWPRFVDEARVDYQFWSEAQDLGANYALLVANALGIPYIR